MKAILKASLCSSNSLSPPLIFVLFRRGFVGESDQIQFWNDIRSDKVEEIEHNAWGEVFGKAGHQVLYHRYRCNDTRNHGDVCRFVGGLRTLFNNIEWREL